MQSDLRGKLSCEIQVSSSADGIYEVFAHNPNHLPKTSPSEIQDCNVQEGEFGKNGSVVIWNYVLDGKASVSKVAMENVDSQKREISFRMIEGDLLTHYKLKSFANHLKVTPKGNNLCVVKFTMEFEKLNEDVSDPTSFVDFLVSVTKNTEAYLKG